MRQILDLNLSKIVVGNLCLYAEVAQHVKNTIYLAFNMSIAEAKNLMFNVYFYVVFFNYYLKFFQEGSAAKIKVETIQKS